MTNTRSSLTCFSSKQPHEAPARCVVGVGILQRSEANKTSNPEPLCCSPKPQIKPSRCQALMPQTTVDAGPVPETKPRLTGHLTRSGWKIVTERTLDLDMGSAMAAGVAGLLPARLLQTKALLLPSSVLQPARFALTYCAVVSSWLLAHSRSCYTLRFHPHSLNPTSRSSRESHRDRIQQPTLH